jgi:Ras-related protein Rab-1A
LQVFDNLFAPRSRSVAEITFRSADGVVLVYNTTNKETLDNLPQYLSDIVAHAPAGLQTVLVGNKSDLAANKAVDTAVAQKYADSLSAKLFEVSAKTGRNVDDAILALVAQIKVRVGI